MERIYARFPCELKVTFDLDSDPRRRAGTLTDIGVGGARLQAPFVPFHVHHRVALHFSGHPRPIEADVVWTLPSGGAAGLHFVTDSEGTVFVRRLVTDAAILGRGRRESA